MADLSIRQLDGTLITSSMEIFSGAVGIGSGVVSGTIRVYNNYDGNDDVPHALKVNMYISAQSGSQAITKGFYDPYRNIQTVLLQSEEYVGWVIFFLLINIHHTEQQTR